MLKNAFTAEKDKVYFENKLAASDADLDRLNDQMKSLSLKLEFSNDTIRNRKLLNDYTYIGFFKGVLSY